MKHAQAEYQFIILNVSGTYISVLYIRPNLPQALFLHCLQTIQQHTRGKSVIMGDLNARHSRWDTTTNSHGRWLVSWASSNHWTVDAPPEATFVGHQGQSTVDLSLVKGLDTSGTRTLSEPWDGSIDHRAVGTQIVSSPIHTLDIPRIPQRQRSNTTYLKKADDLYRSELPRFVDLIHSSDDSDALETLYSALKHIILEPWSAACKHCPRCYKHFWSRRLVYVKKLRSKKYRQAANASSVDKPPLWEQYRAIDRQIRSLVHKNKRRSRNRLTEALTSNDPHERSKVLGSDIKHKTSTSPRQEDSGQLDFSSITKFVATPPGKGYAPPIVPFDMSPAFESKVFQAIAGSKCHRATGTDELFSAAFKLSLALFAKIISLLWVKCSNLGYLLHERRTALLVPIYKRGPKTEPSSYRPIALLSHGRQMISKAIGSSIREEYTFHPTQLGFRENAGTETATEVKFR